jgi:hypothetical protein
VSSPRNPEWNWRIMNRGGEIVEGPQGGFPRHSRRGRSGEGTTDEHGCVGYEEMTGSRGGERTMTFLTRRQHATLFAAIIAIVFATASVGYP